MALLNNYVMLSLTFKKDLLYLYFLCMDVLSTCMYAHCGHAWCPGGQKSTKDLLEMELQTCELLCGCCKSNSGPETWLLTSEPSLASKLEFSSHLLAEGSTILLSMLSGEISVKLYNM